MNPGEKRLAIIFGAAVSCVLGYYIVTGVFIGPATKAKADLENWTQKQSELDMLTRSELNFAERWQKYVNRTFSFDRNQTFDWFGEALKETAAANGFSAPDIKKKSSTKKLGSKTGIEAISYEVTVKDEYTKAMTLLRAMYDSAYISRVTEVQLTPEPREGRNIIKLTFDVATMILPEVPRKESAMFATAKPKMRDADESLGKWRDDFPPDEAFALLEVRNIFREHMPPPANTVLIDNRDIKLVGIDAAFLWEGEVSTQTQSGVEPGKQKQIVGKGDEVDIRGVYADGTEFRQRHAFQDGKPWTYKVPSHTPPLPPKTINLAIDSRDKEEARFTITITEEGGKQKTLPPMVISPETKLPLGDFEAVAIAVSAVYPTGKLVREQRFTPRPGEQVYLIPEQAVAPVEIDEPPVEVVVDDCPPKSGYTVSGLLTYRDPQTGDDKQEMIVNGPDGREIFVAGNTADVIDCGVLIAVCPLGGIVYMQETESYYLYPRGESFEARAKLNAEQPEQLAMAIQEWSQQN